MLPCNRFIIVIFKYINEYCQQIFSTQSNVLWSPEMEKGPCQCLPQRVSYPHGRCQSERRLPSGILLTMWAFFLLLPKLYFENRDTKI